MTTINDARVQGIAAALAELHRLHGNEVEVRDTLDGFGLDLAALRRAGVDSHDMATLKKILTT